MTAKEAIKHLKEAREYPVAYTKEEQEAYEMAFSALIAQQDAEEKSMTNADRIREMADDNLSHVIQCPARFVSNFHSNRCISTYCSTCKLDWLKRPCEGGAADVH
jgi:hypothetical protein